MKKKINININRAPVSSEEIAKNRNFEQVLKGYKAFIKPFYLTKLFLGIATVVVIGGLAVSLFTMPDMKALVPITHENFFKQRSSYSQQVLTTNALPIQEYTINTRKDTILITLKGAKISIPADAIQSTNGVPIVLEVKEAYSMEDIVSAGLNTKSGKELLSSGGMIYIQAKDSSKVHFSKAVGISIPVAEVNYNMNVYKGITSENGVINWQQPKTIKNTIDKKVSLGEELFKANCASCHKIGKDAVGPDLAYIGRRRDKKWLYSFVKNNAVFRANGLMYDSLSEGDYIAKGDAYAICVYEKYNKSEMTAFPTLSKQEIDAIADYCNKEGDRMKVSYPDDQLYLCSKKCEKYNALMVKLSDRKYAIQHKRKGYLQDNGSFVKEIAALSNVLDVSERSAVPSTQRLSLIHGMNKQAEYYEIEIRAFGWYNIDILTKDLPGMVPSKLVVNVDQAYRNMFGLYLVIPALKLNAAGGPLKDNDDQYGFYKDNGTLNLPSKAAAFVYMVGEKDGKLLYASAVFQTSLDNRVTLSPEMISKEEFNKRIKDLCKDETITVQAKESKHAADIRDTDSDLKKIEAKIKEAEKLKPSECDCNCGRGEEVLDGF